MNPLKELRIKWPPFSGSQFPQLQTGGPVGTEGTSYGTGLPIFFLFQGHPRGLAWKTQGPEPLPRLHPIPALNVVSQEGQVRAGTSAV